MIKYYLLILFTCTSFFCNMYSQEGVGINTDNPTKTLHIKSEKDYILKFEDNNSYNGNYTVVSSDTQGTFSVIETDLFKPVKLIKKSGVINTIPISVSSFGDWKVINSEIKLDPGRWAIHLTSTLEYDNLSNIVTANLNSIYEDPTIIVEVTLADEATRVLVPPTQTPNIEGTITASINGNGIVRGSIISPLTKGILKGIIYINNTTSSSKIYRILARSRAIGLNATTESVFANKYIKNLFNSTSDYNQIYAVPLN